MRRVILSIGLLILAIVWLGPLPALAWQGGGGGHAFWAHMTMHMGVVAVAAPLIALGVAGGRFDPVRKVPALIVPIPASFVELVVVWTWHAPALHHAARHSAAGLVLEQSTFLLAALGVWLSAFGGVQRGGPRAASGVVAMLLTAMHMTLLGALIALAPRPLYSDGGASAGAVAFGLTPLEDQHVGGAIMLFGGGVVYLLGGLWLTAGLLRNAASARTVRT